MNEIIHITNRDGVAVVSTLEVAERFGKEHKNVLATIKNLAAENSAAKSMFYETTFENRGKEYPMYLMNRDGFSLLAMGFTGKEALAWKIKYIEAFNQMEAHIRNGGKATPSIEEECRKIRAEAMQMNAKTRSFKATVSAMKDFNLSQVAMEAIGIPLIEDFTGIKTGYRPQIERTYSASEIAQELGCSANLIGKTANANGLKTDEFGVTVLDKAQHSNKQIPTFRYNERGRKRLKELLAPRLTA